MKNCSLISAFSLLVGISANSQIEDTLTDHMAGTPAFYTWGAVNGYVCGNNVYGDEALVQWFDDDYGAIGGGTIEGVLICVNYKTDAGGSFDVVIYEDDGGTIGAIVASVTIDIAAADTSAAAYSAIDGTYAYNVNASFASAPSINIGDRFWAGVVLPTTAAAGDTIALLSNTDGDFPDAATHSGVINAGAFLSYSDAGGIMIANSIYPYVVWTSISGMGDSDFEITMFPNPTNGAMKIRFSNSEAATANILDLTGRKVASFAVNHTTEFNADFSDLSAGIYAIEILNSDNKVISKGKFSKE